MGLCSVAGSGWVQEGEQSPSSLACLLLPADSVCVRVPEGRFQSGVSLRGRRECLCQQGGQALCVQ